MAALTAEERAQVAVAIRRLLALVGEGDLAATATERAFLAGAAEVLGPIRPNAAS